MMQRLNRIWREFVLYAAVALAGFSAIVVAWFLVDWIFHVLGIKT